MQQTALGLVFFVSVVAILQVQVCPQAQAGYIDQEVKIPEKSVTIKHNNGQTTIQLYQEHGSGAYYDFTTQSLYTISDHGPNIKCKYTRAFFGSASFCSKGRVILNPEFQPAIFQWKYNSAQNQFNLEKKIPILTRYGTHALGLPLPSPKPHKLIDGMRRPIPISTKGIDPESIVKLHNGSFYISDEYGPSLLHLDKDGRILTRYVPAGATNFIEDEEIPVVGLLPGILHKHKPGRGIEGIAISPDNRWLFFIQQSPLANPNKKTYEQSRWVRLFKARLNKNGSIQQVVNEYIYPLDIPATFMSKDKTRGDFSVEQDDVKVSDLAALSNDTLLVLERIYITTKIYRINLNQATDILNTQWDDIAQTPSLEQLDYLNRFALSPVKKRKVWSTLDTPDKQYPGKIEGMALINKNRLLLTNDNDSGVYGTHTHFFSVDVPLWK
ncbi:esterase-like activity of phytase family protein [Endozoicomonas sp. SM1973]|uniref:Esterase-like activity of phytase family protein n=1 Tax=Spartinivicinus marinus TaxID=2994442 RepID=A0A853IGC2_9GAMM|nr:esterase-like activity of phytase family protein [Spartinivicinus marinus]MCX4027560.1 esterase-like activity of phytase family protein [Spartinivicinus marinus]NYZ68195.1 esterase-like activity of phytase family protein [Spartinivicinus marinus]